MFLEKLGETSLRVYVLLIEEGRALGVREVQRKMGFKSPSTAKYHLDRLVEFGLAEKTRDGLYKVSESSPKPPVLHAYMTLFGMLIPRLIPYAVFFTVATAIYIVLNIGSLNIFVLFFSVSAALLFWIEGIRFLLLLRKIRRVKKTGR